MVTHFIRSKPPITTGAISVASCDDRGINDGNFIAGIGDGGGKRSPHFGTSADPYTRVSRL